MAWPRIRKRSSGLRRASHSTQVSAAFPEHPAPQQESRERSGWRAHSTPPNTKPIATWCAALSRRKSSPLPMNGTRRAGFRANSTRRPPRSGCSGLGFPEEYGGTAGRQFHVDRRGAGTGAGRRRRRLRQPEEQFDRRAADRARRHAGIQGAGAAGNPVGQEDLGAGDHRAERRLRRRQPAHLGAARRRPLCRQRREDLYHLGHAGRLYHHGGAHRRSPAPAASACW